MKTNWLTATVAIRPLAILAGRTAPAMSTWAMIQPPKMSPLPLASAGIGIDAHHELAVVGQLQRGDAGHDGARVLA